uniref:RWD domain-containing protein n=1 Tax=Octopus bimaculoides TaxID=37653 RepID=A0A0L8FWQ2_OCTBM
MSIRWSIEQNVKDLKDLQASTMAVDCLGQWVLLGGKRALTLMSLENHDHVRKIDRNSKYDISCVQWNPHAVAAEKFAVACGQKLDVYHWQDGSNSSKPICSIKAHSRVVSDLDWSPFDVNILASCSVDSYTFLWDIREPKKPTGSFQTVAGASQVQWNKVTNNTFATTHEGDVRIWDPRKGNTAVQYIAAHPSKIYGLDWSPFSEYNLATCSQDCTVKPFQIGLVTLVLPQLTREPYLYLWNISNLKQPVHTFVGHADVVLDFHWRNKAKGSNDYQLVTWSKDQSLRIWKIDSNLQKLCRQDAANFMDDNIPENLLPEDDEIARVSGSAGTREPSFTSIFHQPQTLLQEFSLVNKDIPRVAFEKMDADSRTCTVSAVSKGHCASLVVTFPVSYPNNAAPTFQFTQRTTLQTSQKNVLLQALEDTSQQHVKRNRSCLEPCLRQLTANLDKLTDVEHQTPDNEDQFTLPTKSGAPIVPNFYYIGHQDSSVPFPRTSGARFCSAGYLVCFGRQASSKKAYTERTPKSLSVLAYLQSGMRSPQSTSSYSVFSRSPPTSDGMFSISNYYAFKEKKRNRSRCRSKDTLDSKGRDSELKKMPKVNPVIIYDVLPLQMLNKQLAENYIIQLNDVPKMCSHNGNAALAVGRKDLVQMWSLLALVAGGGQDFSKDPFDGAPWAQHTFGRKLIKSLLDHYMSIYDIQTCAMLSCLLWTKSVAQQLQQPPHSPKPDKENIPPNSDHSYVDRGSSPEDWNILLFLQLDALPNANHSEGVVGAFTCHPHEGQSGGTDNGHARNGVFYVPPAQETVQGTGNDLARKSYEGQSGGTGNGHAQNEFLQLDALPNANHSESVVGAFTCHPHENGHARNGVFYVPPAQASPGALATISLENPTGASQAVLATATLKMVHLMCHPHKNQSRGTGNDLTWLAGLQSDLAEFLQLDALPNANHSESVVGAFTCHPHENGHARNVFQCLADKLDVFLARHYDGDVVRVCRHARPASQQVDQ